MPKGKIFKTNFSIQKLEKETLKEKTMLINFHGKEDHTFTKIYKFYNRITTSSQEQQINSEWCGAVIAMVVKNVKDAKVLLKLLPIYMFM